MGWLGGVFACGVLICVSLAAIDEAEALLDKVKSGEEDTTSVPTTTTTEATTPPTPLAMPNVTSPKTPTVFGMRVELPADDPFGYDKYGVCAIAPDEQFKVVIYGNHLDKIAQLIFTFTNNCSEPAKVVDATNDFIIHFQHKATFHLLLHQLPENVHAYKMCIRPKPAFTIPGSVIEPLDDISTWLTTEKPPKEYFLPLPLQICFLAFLLCLSALFSGLTLGLMSLTPMELELVQKSGSVAEQKYATQILPVRNKGNLLLCSLLLGNVVVNAAISILFGELTSGLLALVVSSLGIVVFGEIIPQSICVKKGLAVGAHTIAITQFFIFITYPLAWPISKLLDCLLGDEYTSYDRKRLMELMKISMRDNVNMSDELKIAVGAMEIADKVVEDVMTKIGDVFMLPDTTILNAKTVAEIVRMGYTRIPVYMNGEKNNVTDLLFVKDLALLDPDDNFTVKTVCGYHQHPVKFVLDDTPLSVLLEAFKKGDGHLAMVKKLVAGDDNKDPVYELIGIVTLEDIVEEILQFSYFKAEIVDEFDVVTDNVHRHRRKMTRDMTKFYDHEAPTIQISMQIQMVALQWLVANEKAFHGDMIDKTVLERLIRTSARRVDLSTLMAMSSSEHQAIPRIAKLFTKDEPSDHFVLILEGRVEVEIGAGGMKFEAGPWHCFGSEMLAKLVAAANTLSRSTSIVDTTDLVVRRPDLMFSPDYTVVIKEDCTYLAITVANYVNAFKSTMIQRDMAAMKADALSAASHDTLPSGGSPMASRKESDATLPIDDPDAVVRGKRRSPSMSLHDAREAVRALNHMEDRANHNNEEEMSLLNDDERDA